MHLTNAKIVKIYEDELTSCYLKQGIKGNNQYKYDYSKKYKGTNGNYAYGHKTEYSLYVELYIYEYNKYEKFDVRNDILKLNNWERLSKKRLKNIIDNNLNKKVKVAVDGNDIEFDCRQLTISI